MVASSLKIGYPVSNRSSQRSFPESRGLFCGLPSVVLYEYSWHSCPPEVRWPGYAAEHAPPSTKVENAWSYNSISTYTFTVYTRKIYILFVRERGVVFYSYRD
jgi:hypothetical protein